jgi:hypothetical protein
MGADATAIGSLTGMFIPPTNAGIMRVAKAYGNELGTVGNLTYYSGSIDLKAHKQTYNLLVDASVEKGDLKKDNFTIRQIFYNRPPTVIGYSPDFQMYSNEMGLQDTIQMPLNYDVIRLQAMEMTAQIKFNGYSFKHTNNRIRVFPIPQIDGKMWFYYTLDDENLESINTPEPTPLNTIITNTNITQTDIVKISDMSNIPFDNLCYSNINSIGKQWIRKYCLALCKEILGLVRGKYNEMPIPDGSVTLNFGDLVSAAKEEQLALITELKEVLDQSSKQSQMERKAAEVTGLQTQLKSFPLKIYIK